MASNQPPSIKITGIRGSIPSGYLLGRSAPGTGDVQLMTLKAMQSAGLAPVTLPPSGAAGGDLSGTYPNPTVAKINGRAVSGSLPSNTNVLAWNTAGLTWQPLALATVAYSNSYLDLSNLPALTGGSAGQVLTKIDGTDYNFHWAASGGSGGGAASIYDTGTSIYMALVDSDGQMVLDGSGFGIYSLEVFPVASIPALPYASSVLTSAHILVGSAGNVATNVAMTGDVTITNAGVTAIKNDVALGGNPTTTTQSVGNNTTRIATTAFVAAALPVGANPSATGSDAAVNGSAATFMRSDGAPAIQKCSSSVFGLAKVNNTTIEATAGVIGVKFTQPTMQVLLSGTAATYTPTSGAKWIKVRFVGAGGGGCGGGGPTRAGGTTGGDTTFNSIVAKGGIGGDQASVLGGDGGTAGTGTANFRTPGNAGMASTRYTVSVFFATGGNGGASLLGGGAKGGTGAGAGTVGSAAAANTGGGGGGGGSTAATGSGNGAGGGGSGEYVELILPATTYTYTITAGGAGGTAGTDGLAGGAGGSGVIIVEEYYL